jgi:hypothetical protein
MAYTLNDLIAPRTQDDVMEQEVLPELRYRQVRVTDWKQGGVYRGMAYVVAKLRADFRQVNAAIAAGGLPDYAFGLVAPPFGIDVTGWCDLVGLQFYGESRIDATGTKRTITLTNSTATSYGPLVAGSITVLFPATGNRYILDGTITIPASGSVAAPFRSEFTTDSTNGRQYTDSASATIVLVTSSYPGVTATSSPPIYSIVSQAGGGVGTVTPSGTPSDYGVQSHTIAVRIDSTGQAGVAQWSTLLDNGTWTAQSGSSITNFGGLGITITLANNGGNPAFIVGTVYYFTTPGSVITQVGRDRESPQDYGARCKAKIPIFSVSLDANGNPVPISPTESGYVYLARKSSTQVKIAFVAAGVVSGEVRLLVAGQGAPLDAGTVASIQSWFNSRSMLTDSVIVLSPTQSVITLGGATVTVRQAYKTSAQQSINRALALYFGGVDPVRPLSVNPRIDHEYIASLITNTTGVTNVSDVSLTINGVAADLQLPLTPGAYEIPSWTQDIATALTWATA